ncbi:hypothetical protein A3715_17630 [Oleiphilus sp. HI0009]|nr:hypothetical protein A3715_17630 [Oleiphilus sp. HI0009]
MSKTIFITGASSGIGYATAKLFSFHGWDVHGTYNSTYPEDDSFFTSIKKCDLNLDSNAFFKNAFLNIDHIDVLFLNAGYAVPGFIDSINEQFVRDIFNCNVTANIFACQNFIKIYGHRNKSRIIFNSSVLGFSSAPMRSLYVSSKHAIEGFAKSLQIDLKLVNSNISIDVFQPGPVESEFRKNALISLNASKQDVPEYYIPFYNQLEKRLSSIEYSLITPDSADAAMAVYEMSCSRKNVIRKINVLTYLVDIMTRYLPRRLNTVLGAKSGP